jgi:hypothetical protein
VKVSALDTRGQRVRELTVTDSGGAARIAFDSANGSLWYEVLLAPPAGFDRWRFSQFTADELANPAVSGESATPAGDGLANLLKYAFGLPAKIPALRDGIRGQRVALNGYEHLALEYTRVKTATDLQFTAEVSDDLTQWASGPELTELSGVLDLGTQEQVTIRDRVAINDRPRRAMRLKIVRVP